MRVESGWNTLKFVRVVEGKIALPFLDDDKLTYLFSCLGKQVLLQITLCYRYAECRRQNQSVPVPGVGVGHVTPTGKGHVQVERNKVRRESNCNYCVAHDEKK